MKKFVFGFIGLCIILLSFYNILIHNIKVVNIESGNVTLEIFGAYHYYTTY